MKLVDGTDAPLANETIAITVGGNRYKGNYTTDELGQSWFSIDTTSFTELSLEIRVSGRDRGKPLSFSSTGEISIHGLSVFSDSWKIRQVSCQVTSLLFVFSAGYPQSPMNGKCGTYPEFFCGLLCDFLPDFVWLSTFFSSLLGRS